MAMIIDNIYEIGEVVYLRTDPDQFQRLVTGIIVNKYDMIYELSKGAENSRHYDFEISPKKDVLINTE